jgi:hypothetical protein
MRSGIYDESVARNPVLFPMGVGFLIGGVVVAIGTWQWWWAVIGWVSFFVVASVAAFVNIYRDKKEQR